MLLKRIKLENIRSHIHNDVEFPQGSTLLSGDVGSGKSTVLLAIDFALFGLAKGVLSGNALLRNGKDNGCVELFLEVDGKDVAIKRNLKRTSSGISQESGSITINNAKVEKSAVELKQAVLELLNYPPELLTKSKGLIYRYTVYTPQEEMKQILLGEGEVRLGTLRRVFGVDKYKRIKENSKLFLGLMREKRKEFSGMISDLDEKKREKGLKLEEREGVINELNKIKPVHDSLLMEINEKKDKLKLFEEKKELRNSYANEIEVKKNELKNKQHLIEKNNKEIENLNLEINNLEKELTGYAEEDFKPAVHELEERINRDEKELKEAYNRISEINAMRKNSGEMIDKITCLDLCPTCNQKVDDVHKKKVVDDENLKINSFEKEFNEINSRKMLYERAVEEGKLKLKSYNALERKQELMKMRIENLEYKKKNVLRLREENHENLGFANLAIERISKLKDDIEGINLSEYDDVKKEHDILLEKEREVHIKKIGWEKDLKHVNGLILNLDNEIRNKEEIKTSLEYLNTINSWIDDFFLGTMDVMEKKIMLKVHGDFDRLFQKWFDMLIANENLKIKLGEDFSPVIIQDGYDMEYENLSGGEKTAAALAYRLGLNQIINNLASGIKTKDLIILDEPSDGFSEEQLDRMKNVLDELNIKQVIIVSHEDKVESFVNNIIKFRKEEHSTKIDLNI